MKAAARRRDDAAHEAVIFRHEAPSSNDLFATNRYSDESRRPEGGTKAPQERRRQPQHGAMPFIRAAAAHAASKQEARKEVMPFFRFAAAPR